MGSVSSRRKSMCFWGDVGVYGRGSDTLGDSSCVKREKIVGFWKKPMLKFQREQTRLGPWVHAFLYYLQSIVPQSS